MHHLTQNCMKRIHTAALAGCCLLALASCDYEDSTANQWKNWKGTPTQQSDSGIQTPSAQTGAPPTGTQQPPADAGTPPNGTGGAAGTAGNPPADSGTQAPPSTPHTPVSFEVPAGWEHSKESDALAILYKPSADQHTPYYMVEVYRGRMGNSDTAKALAQADHQELIVSCENLCSTPPTLTEKTLAGKQLFVSSAIDDSNGFEIWQSTIFFEKNGSVYIIDLNSLVEDQEQAITKIIETVQGG
jgi:hypothetical protein